VPQRVDHLQTVPLSLRQSERFFSKLKRFKAVATRFEKRDANCRSPYPQVYAPLDQDDFLRLLILFQISSVSLVWKDNLFSLLMDTRLRLATADYGLPLLGLRTGLETFLSETHPKP
jgi:hypothetical protein